MAEQHDRILGYFLEEANEHLNTIEQGLSKLPETVRHPATIRELFRAAHSIKGSAAMLGLTDVQQVGNQFEANFKLLKEQPQIAVDRQLQSLFLESFSFLRAAIEDVKASSDPYRRDLATPDPVGDPVFEELKSYLQHLLERIEPIAESPADPGSVLPSQPAVEQVFGEYVTRKVSEIAALCLQIDLPETRSQIQKICQKLGNLGENFEFLEWSNLFAACRLAIANPYNTLPQLGESIGAAVKQAQVLVLSGRPGTIEIPLSLTTLIERQDRSLQMPTAQSDTFRVDNPHDPFANVHREGDETTQKLVTQPPAAAENLLGSPAPVLSTITNSIQMTTDLSSVLSRSLTENVPINSELASLRTTPLLDLTTDANDDLVNLVTPTASDSDAGTIELDDFMNSLDDELPADGTWMTDDDFLDLKDLGSDRNTLEVLTPVTPLDNISELSSATVATDYDEETFYTPDLDDRDMVNFWSETQLAAQPQSLYASLDLPENTGDRFQPDSSPTLDLNPATPDFTLDRPISELFPQSIAARSESESDLAQQSDDRSATAVAANFESEPAIELESLSLDFANNSSDLDPIAPVGLESQLDLDRDFATAPVARPATNLTNDLTSDLLYLEDLNSPQPSLVSETTVSAELTNWIDFSLEQNDTDLFDDVDLDVLDSNQPILDLVPDFNPSTNGNTSLGESNLAVEALDFNLASDAERELPVASDRHLDELDFNDLSSDLPELESALDLDALDFNLSTDDDNVDSPVASDCHLDELDFNRADDNSSDLTSTLATDIQELAELDFSNKLDSVFVNGAELNELSDFGELDLSFLDEEHTELEPIAMSQEHIDRFDERESTLAPANELFENFDLNELSIDAVTAPELAPHDRLESDNFDTTAFATDFAELDLDLLDRSGSLPELSGTAEITDLNLDVVFDRDMNVDLMGVGEAAITDDRLSQFEDLSELDFNLDASTGTLADGDLLDLESMLDATPSANLAAMDSFDALLGGAAALGIGGTLLAQQGAFDGLDDLIGTPAPTVTAAAPLDDLDRLLATPTIPAVPTPTVTAEPKTPDRRSKQRTFEQTMRVSVRHLDNLNNLVGELVVNRNTLEQDQNRMRQFVEKLLSEVQKLNEVGKRMQDLYERSLMENSLVASRQQTKPSAPSTVPANLQDLEQTGALMEYDPLEMDRFTPIHLLSQKMIELTVRIRESTADIEFVVDGSTEVTRTLRQITGQLQEDLTKSRMVPFAQTADRLQRGVRENGLKYGKQIELSVDGRDTPIDKVILESLTDPLIHMVNNAIAHGIESAETRQAAGKPSEGKITIRALHQGNQTIISISDDGAGINTERVKAKAIEKGIITTHQAAAMTKTEAYELLFLPSFSTKDEADELAGRGVGMDVVRTSLTEIRGTIATESQLGVGTTFTIRLPLALSIAKALIAANNKTNIAFPMDGIEDTQDVSPEQIQTNQAGEQCIFWRDELMPFKPLSELLGFNRPLSRNNFYGTQEDDSDLISILILRSDGNLIAVQVDKIVGDQEIVIKPLQGPAPKPLGIAGATVLGDGRIVPIADVMELIALAKGTLTRQVSTQWADLISKPTVELRESMVLIVDDSITVRELLSLTFKRAGYRVEQARDGQEAWDKLRAGLPCDIVFCDIEMPRMDGLEFLSRIQKDAALKKVPVAMLTSRGSDRHRQIAAQLGASGYFIKPYLEEALLDAAKRMIQGEVLAIV